MIKRPSRLQRYGLAVLFVALAFVLTLVLDYWMGMAKTPFILFFAALTVSAWYGGQKAGLLATVLSALLVNFFFQTPLFRFGVDLADGVRLGIFILESVLISRLCGALRTAQEHTKASLHLLQANETRFRRLVNSNIIGVVSCTFQGLVTEANDEFLRMTGYSAEEIRSGQVRWENFAASEFQQVDASAFKELVAKYRHTPYETALVGKQNQQVPVVVGSTRLENEPESFISFVLDLTRLKRAEHLLAVQYAVTRVLAEAETLSEAVPTILRSLCESLNAQLGVIWTVDAQAAVLRYVESWQTATLNADELIARKQQTTFALGVGLPGHIWATGHADWSTELADGITSPNVAQATSAGLRMVLGVPILLEHEVLGVIECFGTQLPSPDDDLLQLATAIGSQIGQFMERKRAEEALRESESRFRRMVETAEEGIWALDADGNTTFVNQKMADLLGYTVDEMQGQSVFEFMDPDNAAQVEHRLAQRRQGLSDHYDSRLRRRDGSVLWALMSVSPIMNEEKQYLGALAMVTDITARKRTEAALAESNQTLKAIVQACPLAIMGLRADGTVRLWNPAAERIFGWSSAEVLGQVLPAIPNGKQEEFQRNIAVTMQGQVLSGTETRRQTKTGEIIDVALWSAVVDEAQTGISCLSVVADISDRKQAEVEREQLLQREQTARQEAEAANRIKDEFLAVLSHELRSPLNPILGWTQLLRSRQFDAATIDKALETIERNAKLQTQLIEDLLDVSRILQGKMTLKVGSVYLVPVIEAAIETVRLAAEAKGIQIRTRFADAAEPVAGDAGRIQQIIWNLLSNAVKFTPPGGAIDVELEPIISPPPGSQPPLAIAEPPYVEITVTDTGKGIQPEFLPHVFDYFRQEDGTITRQFGGLGLGLAIVRHLTELHGGTVKVSSPGEGKGATFTVRLPCLISTEPSLTDSAIAATSNLSNIRVLVVDDELDMRDLAMAVLSEFGATVQTAASAQEALLLLQSFQPNVLICDIGMPDMDGYRLMRQIRSLPADQGGTIPAIALTAYAGELDRQQALAAGFQLHLAKPVEPSELVAEIAQLVQG